MIVDVVVFSVETDAGCDGSGADISAFRVVADLLLLLLLLLLLMFLMLLLCPLLSILLLKILSLLFTVTCFVCYGSTMIISFKQLTS